MTRHHEFFPRVAAIALAVLVAAAFAAGAQDVESKTATIGPPQPIRADVGTMARAPQNPEEELRRRSDRIGDHHRDAVPLEPMPSSARVSLVPTAQAVSVSPSNVEIFIHTPLASGATNGMTSGVGEPSVGVRGAHVLFTGNWYAAFSSNGGASFSYRNPSTTFPSVDDGFCCDQLAFYEEDHDLMVWFLQYVESGGENTARLAVASGADIAAERWHFYDFTPRDVGNWSGEWFDYPEIAAGDDFLYLTTNAFSAAGQFRRSAILRLPLAELAAYQGFSYNYFDSESFGSLRPTHGGSDTMYFGTHRNLATMRVFTWPEDSTVINGVDVAVDPWSNGQRSAPGPDGRDWLGRVDPRVTGAWASGSTIGFAWTAAQDSAYPFPQVRVAILDENTKALLAEPHIWRSDTAFAYPAAALNGEGKVGIAVAQGGGSDFPNALVGYLEDAALADWRLAEAERGTHGPARNVWGDYFAVRAVPGAAESWAATGFTQQGGSQQSDVQPFYVGFRKGDGGPPPIEIELRNLGPDRLEAGEEARVLAVVTRGGSPAPGEEVVFESSDVALITLSAASANTDSEGRAETTAIAGTAEGSATVTAGAGGASAAVAFELGAPPKVPDLSRLWFALLLLGLWISAWLWSRTTRAREDGGG